MSVANNDTIFAVSVAMCIARNNADARCYLRQRSGGGYPSEGGDSGGEVMCAAAVFSDGLGGGDDGSLANILWRLRKNYFGGDRFSGVHPPGTRCSCEHAPPRPYSCAWFTDRSTQVDTRQVRHTLRTSSFVDNALYDASQ